MGLPGKIGLTLTVTILISLYLDLFDKLLNIIGTVLPIIQALIDTGALALIAESMRTGATHLIEDLMGLAVKEGIGLVGVYLISKCLDYIGILFPMVRALIGAGVLPPKDRFGNTDTAVYISNWRNIIFNAGMLLILLGCGVGFVIRARRTSFREEQGRVGRQTVAWLIWSGIRFRSTMEAVQSLVVRTGEIGVPGAYPDEEILLEEPEYIRPDMTHVDLEVYIVDGKIYLKDKQETQNQDEKSAKKKERKPKRKKWSQKSTLEKLLPTPSEKWELRKSMMESGKTPMLPERGKDVSGVWVLLMLLI